MDKPFVWLAVRSNRKSDTGLPLYKIEPLPPKYSMLRGAAFKSRELVDVQRWVEAENNRLTRKRGGITLGEIKAAKSDHRLSYQVPGGGYIGP